MKANEHIEGCRKRYRRYFQKPNVANLRLLSDYLDKMKESSAESVKKERQRAMAFVRRESRHFLTKAKRIDNPSIKENLKAKYPQVDIEYLSEADLSGRDKYLPWMVKMVVKNNEAKDAVANAAREFHRNVDRLSRKDLFRYKSYEDVIRAVSALSPTRKEKAGVASEGVREIFNDDKLRVIEVTNKEAAIKYGKGTRWCISATKSNNLFDDYYWKGSRMFIFLPKDPSKEKITLRFDENNQIVEIREPAQRKQLTLNSIGYLHPRLKEIVEQIRREELSKPNLAQRLAKGEISQEELRSLMKYPVARVREEVARRIDAKYLPEMMKDSDGEVRSMVAEGIDAKYLPEMMKDSYEVVRGVVAKRIDSKYLPEMMKDSYEYVRRRVAERIDAKYLPEMMKDSDEMVRTIVANRIDPKYLPEMMKDSDKYVRSSVAKRIDLKYLPEMMKDSYEAVRDIVAKRIDPKYLPEMMKDSYKYVRSMVAKRIDAKYLPQMMKDSYWNVRETAAERMRELGMNP